MARRDKGGRGALAEALEASFASGDHRAARARARAALADPAAGPAEREGAEAALRRVRPDPAAALLAGCALALLVLLAALGLAR